MYNELLIDEVLNWAYQWDKFISKLTCVDVAFFKSNSKCIKNMLY